MAAYLLSDVTVRDPEAFQTYRMRAADSISRHGGTYLVRGGGVEPLEGTWTPRTIIVVEFPSLEQARAWHAPEHASALDVRDKALSRNLILVDGVGAST